MEAQLLKLAQKFDLPEVTSDQIKSLEHYLMKGKKEIRVIKVLKVNDDNTVQFQPLNIPDQKLHTSQIKSLVNLLRGPIPPSILAEVSAEFADS